MKSRIDGHLDPSKELDKIISRAFARQKMKDEATFEALGLDVIG